MKLPKAKKRIPAMSKKRQVENREYLKKRKAFLRARPKCDIRFTHCTIWATDIHHVQGRLGGNYLNVATWLPVCRNCHNWIHTHPSEAHILGYLSNETTKPYSPS